LHEMSATVQDSIDLHRIEAPANRWTFGPKPVRRFVERRLEGRVLNLFAGRTELKHDGKIIRNDLDDSVSADHHVDALDVGELFSSRSFDTVILDPPYSVRKSREKYDGEYQGKFSAVKDQVATICRVGGRVITFGYDSTGMGQQRGYELQEAAMINHKGDINDTIATVEQRVERKLTEYAQT